MRNTQGTNMQLESLFRLWSSGQPRHVHPMYYRSIFSLKLWMFNCKVPDSGPPLGPQLRLRERHTA